MSSSGREVSKQEIIDMAKRMIKAFKNIQCFVFERDEIHVVRKVIDEVGLSRLVRIGRADKRYPYIYIVKPNLNPFMKECSDKAEKTILEGRVREEYKKQFRIEYIRQCLNHYEHERVKEIIGLLEKYLREHGVGE